MTHTEGDFIKFNRRCLFLESNIRELRRSSKDCERLKN